MIVDDDDTPVLELRDVVKIFGTGEASTPALRGVTCAVARGEFVAVMGPSGSGKSTLLHVAVGLVETDAGEVAVDGRPVPFADRARWAALRRRRFGMLYQRLNLVPGLSALENVEVPLLLDRHTRRDAALEARRALERVGLGGVGDRRPEELSGGARVLVGLARAIVGPRDLVLADEPTGALDSVAGERVMDVLADLAAGGTSVLMVTHDSRVASWADRIVTLRDGLSAPAIAAVPSR